MYSSCFSTEDRESKDLIEINVKHWSLNFVCCCVSIYVKFLGKHIRLGPSIKTSLWGEGKKSINAHWCLLISSFRMDRGKSFSILMTFGWSCWLKEDLWVLGSLYLESLPKSFWTIFESIFPPIDDIRLCSRL